MLGLYKPFVWEYSRLNMTHAVMSKRKLAQLVAGGHVSGWDDPRMLTLSGMRRRGITPAVSLHLPSRAPGPLSAADTDVCGCRCGNHAPGTS